MFVDHEAERWCRTYTQYLHSAQWKEMEERVLSRDLGRCRVCHTSENITVHNWLKAYPSMNECATVCADCLGTWYLLNRQRVTKWLSERRGGLETAVPSTPTRSR
jgi:hypothetical protein